MDVSELERILRTMESWGQTRLRTLLTALAEAAEPPQEYIREVAAQLGKDRTPIVCEYEYDVTERILGAAFVAVQAQITRVVSGALEIRKRADAAGHATERIANTKKALVDYECIQHPRQECIREIDDAANYFKHSAEWGADWKKLNSVSRDTAARVAKCGATPEAPDNMHRLLRHLGYELPQLPLLAHDVDDWMVTIINRCRDVVDDLR